MRLLARASVFFAVLACAACTTEEHAILVEARSEIDVAELHVTLVELGSGAGDASVRTIRLGPRPIGRSAREIDVAPIRIAINLQGPGAYALHMRACAVAGCPNTAAQAVASRCYSASEVLEDSVLLATLDVAADPDWDGFPARARDACRDPGAGAGSVDCDYACPEAVAADCIGCLSGACTADPSTIHPGARELCNDGVDQSCDGNDSPCEDRDGDGFRACSSADPAGSCDCDDDATAVRPGAQDTCGDGVDQDCNGSDARCDLDGDGYPADRPLDGSPDCNDRDPTIHPDAEELCDEIDNDCDRLVDEPAECAPADLDRDGSPACASGQTSGCDPNDCDAAIHPGAADHCGNGIDEDGSGADQPCAPDDLDRDGAPGGVGGTDCNDDDARFRPGAFEFCGDGLAQDCFADVDCNGDTDDDRYVEPSRCEGNAAITPYAAELCNGIDDNCDDVTDEVLAPPEAGTYPQGRRGCVVGDVRVPGCTGSCALSFVDNIFHCGACRNYCNDDGLERADACTDGRCTCGSEAACEGTRDDYCCGADGCHDLLTELDHCGSCGMDCIAEHGADSVDSCRDGACSCGASGAPCGAGQRCCGGSCVPVIDNNNCGGCGIRCGANSTCNGSSCVCTGSFLDCNGVMVDGCEADRLTDEQHCGSCPNTCSVAQGTPECVAGTCTVGSCSPTFDDCDETYSTGCETPLTTLEDCNGCDVACTRANAVATCSTQSCAISSCLPNFASCDMVDATGCETDLRSTTTSCGSCSNNCRGLLRVVSARVSCAAGSCVIPSDGCVAGYGNCDAIVATGCETNTTSTAAHCGACGADCRDDPNVTGATCAGSACSYTCSPGYTDCTPGAGAPGCEVHTSVDPDRCGSCTNDCSSHPHATSSSTCLAGSCVYACETGYRDCGPANGCETNTTTDAANCGGCGNNCLTLLPHVSAASCSSGMCQVTTCAPGFDDCSAAPGCETPITDDVANCGGCGVSCGAGETCAGGACVCAGSMGSVGGGAVCSGGTTCCAGGCELVCL